MCVCVCVHALVFMHVLFSVPVQILRNHVMVRVGGGWDTLEHYLDKHDPCRCSSLCEFSLPSPPAPTHPHTHTPAHLVSMLATVLLTAPERTSPSHLQSANVLQYSSHRALRCNCLTSAKCVLTLLAQCGRRIVSRQRLADL